MVAIYDSSQKENYYYNYYRNNCPTFHFVLTQILTFYLSIVYDTRLTQHMKILRILSSLFECSGRFYGKIVRLTGS